MIGLLQASYCCIQFIYADALWFKYNYGDLKLEASNESKFRTAYIKQIR